MTHLPLSSRADDTDALTPSMKSAVGSAMSYGATLREESDIPGRAMLGLWKAEPGVYPHPGDERGETFVVLGGSATLDVPGSEPQQLEPMTVINVPPLTPTTMTVHETLLKVSFVLR